MKRRVLTPVVALVVGVLALATPLWAQTVMPEEHLEIVVTATRTERDPQDVPYSVVSVDRRQIERRATDAVAELLRHVAGVDVTDQSVAGLQRLRIRGENGARVLVLVDGERITDQRSVHEGAPILIDPQSIERIEVVKGPASVLYGSDAMGGVVNIITRARAAHPTARGLSGGASVGYDSGSDLRRTGLTLAAGGEHLDLRLDGSWVEASDRETPGGVLANSAYRGTSFRGTLRYRLERGDVGLQVETYRREAGAHTPDDLIAPPITGFQLDFPRRSRDKVSLFANLDEGGSTAGRWRLGASRQRLDRELLQHIAMELPSGPSTLLISSELRIDAVEDTLTSHLQYSRLIGVDHDVTMGLKMTRDSMEAATYRASSSRVADTQDPGRTSSSLTRDLTHLDALALFVQDEWQVTDRLRLVLGLRQSVYDGGLDRTDNPDLDLRRHRYRRLVGSLAGAYRLGRQVTWRASLVQGYRVANLLQLYTGSGHGTRRVNYPNPDLAPETSWHLETGLRRSRGPVTFDAAIFYEAGRNYISRQPYTPPGGAKGLRFENSDEMRSWGADVELRARMAGRLRPHLSATYLVRRERFGDFETDETGLPRFQGRLGIGYLRDLGRQEVELDLSTAWAGRATQAYSDGSADVYEGWQTIDGRVTWRWERPGPIDLTLALYNLTDERYTPATEGLEAPGRRVALSITTHF